MLTFKLSFTKYKGGSLVELGAGLMERRNGKEEERRAIARWTNDCFRQRESQYL